MAEFCFVTGLSGAGRSTAAAALEDMGWFVIDNLPASLIAKVAELVGQPGSETEKVALVMGRDGSERPAEIIPILSALRAGRHRVRLLFLDAPDDVLIRRFEGTRRRHPLAAQGVEASVSDERQRLEVLRTVADVVVDTGDLNSNQLRQRILELFGDDEGRGAMQISVTSFGYKFGLPLDVDLVFDCRFLPNPYWDEELRPLSGQDSAVRDFVLSQEAASDFLDRVGALLEFLIPAYEKEGKSYLTVALGCTGGRHRSVALSEALSARLVASGLRVNSFHRDIDR